MPALILLVAMDRSVAQRTERVLADIGYRVAATCTFEHAKTLLDSLSPDLLIADVRLGAFNGLHLATLCRIARPEVPVIIMHASPDPLIESDAARLGAKFIVKPLENPEFQGLVEAALREPGPAQPMNRRWQRKRIRGVIDAELAALPARIWDVSYGGLRLAYSDDRWLPEVFDVTVPKLGLTMKARSVWTVRSPADDEFWCGAEVLDSSPSEMAGWRDFVDVTI